MGVNKKTLILTAKLSSAEMSHCELLGEGNGFLCEQQFKKF
jgi:hypothetical protein